MNKIATKLQLMWHLNVIAPYSIESIKSALTPVVLLHGIQFDDKAVYFTNGEVDIAEVNTSLNGRTLKIPFSDIIYCGNSGANGCVEIISRRYFVMYLWPDRQGQLLQILMKAPCFRSMFDTIRQRFSAHRS